MLIATQDLGTFKVEASKAVDRRLKTKQARTERQGQSLLCVQCKPTTQILLIDFVSDVYLCLFSHVNVIIFCQSEESVSNYAT